MSGIGIELLVPKRFGDSRGFFAETYNLRRYEEFGITQKFVQDNHFEHQFSVTALHPAQIVALLFELTGFEYHH